MEAETGTVLLCTASYDRTIRFWEALSGICSRTVQHADSHVNRMQLSGDKRLLATAGHAHVRLYDALSTHPHPLLTAEGHQGNVVSVAFEHAARWIVSAGEDGTVRLWDTRIPTATATATTNPSAATTASTASKPQREYRLPAPATDVVIHPNQGEIIACAQNGAIRIWDLTSDACSHELIPDDDVPMRSLSIAPDGSALVAGNNKGRVYVWSMRSHQLQNVTEPVPVAMVQAHNDYLLRCLLSPDGKHLATTSADKTIKLWSVALDRPDPVQHERTMEGHERWVWDCAFSADSEYLVSASSDTTARLWDLASGETIRQYQGHQKAAVCVALNDLSV